jgi:YHS domain-containing protein
VNVQDYSSLSRLYGVETIPCDVIMTPSGRVLYKLQCPQEPRQYVGQLNQAAAAATGAIAGGPGGGQQFASVAAPSVPATSPNSNVLRPQAGASAPTVANLTLDAATSGPAFASPSSPPASVFSAPPAPQPRAAAVASDAGGTMTASYRPNMPGLSVNSAGAGQSLAPGARANGQPHLGLDGFCPVTLIERSLAAPSDPRAWQHGDSRWGAVHRGVTYLFVGPEEQKRFLQHPDHFAPALSGNDPVLAFDRGQMREGRREFGALSDGRMYLFVDENNFNLFKRDPKHYEQQVWRAENSQPSAMR